MCYFYTILHSIRAQFYVHTCFCTFYYSYAENQRFLLIFGYWATLWMAGSSRTYSSWLTKKFDKSQTTLLPSYIILDPYFNQKYAKKKFWLPPPKTSILGGAAPPITGVKKHFFLHAEQNSFIINHKKELISHEKEDSFRALTTKIIYHRIESWIWCP